MKAEEFERVGLEALRAMPKNPDGTKGYFLTSATPEFWEWVDFFERNRMPFRARYLRGQHEAGAYLPALSPCDVDAGFMPRLKPSARAPEVSAEDRRRLAETVKRSFAGIPRARGRFEGEDARAQEAPRLPEARELTDAERASMAKLMRRGDGADVPAV